MNRLAISVVITGVVLLVVAFFVEAGPFQTYTIYPPLSGMGTTDVHAIVREARIKLISVFAFSVSIGAITFMMLSRKK